MLRVRIGPELDEALKAGARARGESVAVFVRDALVEALRQQTDVREVLKRWKK